MGKISKLHLIAFSMFYFGIDTDTIAQSKDGSQLNWFVSSSVGIQMSGIKSKDFVQSNYSPLLNISVVNGFHQSLPFNLDIGVDILIQ